MYNTQLWELCLLRLNQLSYFEALKPEQDSEVASERRPTTRWTSTLKVKEKGKNSIGLNGGLSGLSGAFVGLNYETNNFLGLGEIAAVVRLASASYQSNVMLGFTEPYLFDKPIQTGFTAYYRTFKFNQAQQAGISSTQAAMESSAFQNSLQNYTQASRGFTLSSSYAVRRSFKRFGLSYSFDTSDITPISLASKDYFYELAFRSGVSGPDVVHGIVTSKLVPSFSKSTIDNPMRPHSGSSYFVGMDIAGVGGNVDYLRPIGEYKKFIPMKGLHMNKQGLQTLGFRVQGSFITGFAGNTAPPFERFFQGGDTDLRGFDIRTASPTALIADQVDVTLTNPDGSPVPKDPNNPRAGNYTINVPVQRLVYPGGDTSIVANVEYRIPLAGPVTLALFVDAGMNMAVRESQLRLAGQEISELDSAQYGCPAYDPTYTSCVGTQSLKISPYITPLAHTNYVVRMSTGAEMQILLPMVNAPFRLYYAYNPLRVDTVNPAIDEITRNMFPAGEAGEYTYLNTIGTYEPGYRLREPRKTFRFTVATTF